MKISIFSYKKATPNGLYTGVKSNRCSYFHYICL